MKQFMEVYRQYDFICMVYFKNRQNQIILSRYANMGGETIRKSKELIMNKGDFPPKGRRCVYEEINVVWLICSTS